MLTKETPQSMPALPPHQSGEETYRKLMAEIDPTLPDPSEIDEMTPDLEARYRNAAQEYERRYAQLQVDEQAKLINFRRSLNKGVEEKTDQSEASELANLESAIDAL